MAKIIKDVSHGAFYIAVENVNYKTIWETIWHYLAKLNICLSSVSTVARIYPGEILAHVPRK